MVKHDWLDLCIQMLIDLAPQNIDSAREYGRYEALSTHFTSISGHLSERIKTTHNVDVILNDDFVETQVLAQIMNRLTQNGYMYAKNQIEECKHIAITAITRYESLLSDGQLNEVQRLYVIAGISELRKVIESMED
jgi:hypothetical protein